MAQNFDGRSGNPFLKRLSGSMTQQIFLNRIIDQMLEALVFLDLDLNFRFANRAFFELFGFEEEDILGQSIRKLGIDDNFSNMSTLEIANILRGQKFWQGEVLRRNKSGYYIPVLVTAKAAYDDQGDLEGFIGTYQDLRQIRQTELRLKNNLTQTIIAMAKAIEDRDLFKSNHHSKINDLSVAIALDLGKDTSFIEGLSLAAVLHDIGKIFVPSEILNFAGTLTDKEMEIVRTHPNVGYEILKDIELPWPVAEIVWQHHERLDGSGYPNRLKNDEILFGAKILAVADVVDSMYADRPHRGGYDVEICLDEIRKNRGIIYENDVVDACLDIIQSNRHTLKRR